MLPKDKVSKLIGIFILLTLLIITITLAMTVFTIFQRGLKISEGTLGFVGAILGGIIAGYITLKGVNKTIEVGNRERFEDSYNIQMKSIYNLLNKLSEVSGFTYNFLFEDKEVTTLSVTERVKFLKQLIESVHAEFPKLLGVVDWHLVQKIDRLSMNFNHIHFLEHILTVENPHLEFVNKDVHELREQVFEIYTCLNEHKDFLIDKYNKRIN